MVEIAEVDEANKVEDSAEAEEEEDSMADSQEDPGGLVLGSWSFSRRLRSFSSLSRPPMRL